MSDLDGRCFLKRMTPSPSLVPADFAAEDMLAAIKDGREVLITLRKARSPEHHRFFFALLHKVVDNDERWANESDLLDDLKLAVGHSRRTINMRTGEPAFIPKSINFASMDEGAFTRFKERCLHILEGAGIDTARLIKEVMETQRKHGTPRRATP